MKEQKALTVKYREEIRIKQLEQEVLRQEMQKLQVVSEEAEDTPLKVKDNKLMGE